MKLSRGLACLSIVTVCTTLLGGMYAPAQAASGHRKVVVSRVKASAKPVPLGTEVTVAFRLTNKKRHATVKRRVQLSLVDSVGRTHRLDAARAPRIAPATTRRFRATRTVTDVAAGTYRVKVCFPAVGRHSCATSAALSIRIVPASASATAVLKLGADVVTVPLGDGQGTFPATRVQVTNTGRGPTGALTFAFTTSRSAPRAPSTEFEAASTTCGTSLTSGQTCTVDVRRTATSTASSRAVLTVSGSRGASDSADLVGPVRIEPGSYDFDDVAVGESALHTFDLVNESTEAVGILGGTLDFVDFTYAVFSDAPFTCASMNGAVQLAPGESCTLTVGFAPLSTGEKSSLGGIYTSVGLAPFEVSGTALPGSGDPLMRRPGRSDAWR